MSLDTIPTRLAEVRALMTERLGFRGATLSDQVRRAGRRLPARVRRAAATLIAAEPLLENPKLSRRVDGAALARALEVMETHLATIDRRAERITRVVQVLALIALQLMILGAGVLAVLHWRGLI